MSDVDMIYLWMAPWDAGGTFRIGSRPKMAIRRDRLRCVVQYFGGLAWTSVIDLYAGVSTAPVGIMAEHVIFQHGQLREASGQR